VLVYGPADHTCTKEFLSELVREVSSYRYPVVLGGDFNLILRAGDKNDTNVNWPRVHRFNDAIAAML
jgi:endonuclease/exonuclease/phosphatase (EEP) superfamily protein YafD